MADPIVYDSQLSVFKLTDNGATERDLTDYIVNITPHFGRRMSENTTLNHSHEQAYPGLNVTSFDLEFVYSEDALVGTDTVLGPLLTDTTARAYKYYPRGTGGKLYSGTGYLENYQPLTKVGTIVTATATLRCISRTRT